MELVPERLAWVEMLALRVRLVKLEMMVLGLHLRSLRASALEA